MQDPTQNKTLIDLHELLDRADHIVATSVVGRPKLGSGYVPKVDAKIRLDKDVMEWLKSKGPRHYSRINGLLMALMEAERKSRQETSTMRQTEDLQ